MLVYIRQKGMPMAPRARGEGKTPHRTFRIEDDLWDAFDVAARQQGEPDRSTVLREFVAWYVHAEGAKMPKRPAKIDGHNPGTE